MFAMMLSAPVYAEVSCQNSYGIVTTVNGELGQTICSNKADDFIDLVKELKNTNTSYTDTSQAEIQGRFNDVDMTLNYAANSNTLIFSAPELNIAERSFTGSTRKEAQKQFTDWLKKSGVIGEVMNYQAKHSALSPITGVGGVMPTLATNDFNNEMTQASNVNHATNNPSGSGQIVGLGVNAGSYSVKGSAENVDTATLPLSYSFDMKKGSGQKLILSMPLTMYQVGSAKGYHAGFGVGYRYPINQKWTLTPSLRYTLSGSIDRATVASVVSGSLMSTYTMPVGKYDLSFGNMVGYYKTGKFKVGDYSFDPKIKQTMLRNGIMLSQPVSFKGKKLAVEYSIIDTRYVGGNKPFLSSMQEYGLTLGLHKDEPKKSKLSSLRGGISYMRAKNAKGLTANVGYWF